MRKGSLPLSVASFLTVVLVADLASAAMRYQKVLPLVPSIFIAAAALAFAIWSWISARADAARWPRVLAILCAVADLLFLVGYAVLQRMLSLGPHPYK